MNSLYRPRNDRVIAGVCAGLARRFGMTPWTVRLLFLLSCLLPGLVRRLPGSLGDDAERGPHHGARPLAQDQRLRLAGLARGVRSGHHHSRGKGRSRGA